MVRASTPFVRASALTGRPVVTAAGDSAYEVQDLVVDHDGRTVSGLTLRKPGVFGRRHVGVAPVAKVDAIGADAVMIPAGDGVVEPEAEALSVVADVVGVRVVAEDGHEVGTVTDVIVETRRGHSRIEGLEVARPGIEARGYLALDHGTSVSGDAVVVTKASLDHLATSPDDLTTAVGALRSRKASS